MERFGVVKEGASVTKEVREVYNKLYKTKLSPNEFVAARELFPSARAASRTRGRRGVSAAA